MPVLYFKGAVSFFTHTAVITNESRSEDRGSPLCDMKFEEPTLSLAVVADVFVMVKMGSGIRFPCLMYTNEGVWRLFAGVFRLPQKQNFRLLELRVGAGGQLICDVNRSPRKLLGFNDYFNAFNSRFTPLIAAGTRAVHLSGEVADMCRRSVQTMLDTAVADFLRSTAASDKLPADVAVDTNRDESSQRVGISANGAWNVSCVTKVPSANDDQCTDEMYFALLPNEPALTTIPDAMADTCTCWLREDKSLGYATSGPETPVLLAMRQPMQIACGDVCIIEQQKLAMRFPCVLKLRGRQSRVFFGVLAGPHQQRYLLEAVRTHSRWLFSCETFSMRRAGLPKRFREFRDPHPGTAIRPAALVRARLHPDFAARCAEFIRCSVASMRVPALAAVKTSPVTAKRKRSVASKPCVSEPLYAHVQVEQYRLKLVDAFLLLHQQQLKLQLLQMQWQQMEFEAFLQQQQLHFLTAMQLWH
jgi:hypothetical protein